MAWFKVSDGRVVYPGNIDRAPYNAWLVTREGTAAIATVAGHLGFQLFGRTRAARNRVWREIQAAAKSTDGRAALQAAADAYVRSISSLAYAQGLPRLTVGLRRLVLVPRALVADRARSATTSRLTQCRALAERPLPERDFLFETVLTQVDEAMRLAKPSIHQPLRGADGWNVIGADTRFQWVDRYWSGQSWTGHWFVYELPRTPLSRADRNAVERAVLHLRASVANLPRERRYALVKLAAT